jgi:hypothetical protein
MTLTHALRYASLFAVAAVLTVSLGTHSLYAQSAGTPAADSDSAAKKKADAAKAAKSAAEKPQKPAAVTTPGRQDPTGY